MAQNRPKIPSSVWALGFVSLLMDVSSEMIHSLLPLFLVTHLQISASGLGLLEGLAEATALIVKIFSGALSDYLGKRKLLAIFGYSLGAFSKPLFAIAAGMPLAFAARMIDRIGKGIRGAPRDALIADITPAEIRGAAFGLRQSLDTVGAFLGPLLATALMMLWHDNFRAVFWIAVIPGVLAVLVLQLAVHEPNIAARRAAGNPIRGANLRRLQTDYWYVVTVGAVFTLARFSEAFLLLRSQQCGLPIALTPLVMVAMNLIYAVSAYPLGKLSDRQQPKRLLGWGLLLLIAADVALADADSLQQLIAGVALWGLHMGMTQGLLAKLVADTAPTDLRGTAFGLFNLVGGLAMLLASVIAGLLWDNFGAPATFSAGAVFSLLAWLLLALPQASAKTLGNATTPRDLD